MTIDFGEDYVEYTTADGKRSRQRCPEIQHVASDIKATGPYFNQAGTSFSFTEGGVTQTVSYRKNWHYELERAREIGEQVTDLSGNRQVLVIVVAATQSNGGRGKNDDIPQEFLDLMDSTPAHLGGLKISDCIWPNDPMQPVIEYGDGPASSPAISGDKVVGEAMMLGAIILSETSFYDRVTIIGAYVGNTTVLSHWDGSSGHWIDKRDDSEVMNGTSVANPPGFIRADDHCLIICNIGEADAASETDPATYRSQLTAAIGKVRADLGDATFLGTFYGGLSESRKSIGGTDESWAATRRAQEESDNFRSSVRPNCVYFYLETDMEPTDLIHARASGHYNAAKVHFGFCKRHARLSQSMGLVLREVFSLETQGGLTVETQGGIAIDESRFAVSIIALLETQGGLTLETQGGLELESN